MDIVVAGRVRWCPTCRAIYRADFARCPIDGDALRLGMTDPMIGTTIATHYVIDAFLGEGAMARVYRAHHARLEHKQFAVKIMIGDLAATLEMRLRFAQEADAASQLDHPNVVSVVDFGKTETGQMFLAMELVDGRTLAEVIVAEGPLAPARALALTRQLCNGLGHAHERGLVHRDLKPDNIVVAGSPELVRIVDFGLAIPVDDQQSPRLTGVGLAMGTPVYASPEQTHNEDVDHRADLFALGVTLYEMLAGKPPYEGNTLELIHMNARDTVPAIAARSGVEVPVAIEAIAQKLMRRDPSQRFADAAAVIVAIDAANDAVIAAAQATRVVVLPPAPQRSRAPVIVIGALVVAAAAAYVVVPHVGNRAPVLAAAVMPVAAQSPRHPTIETIEPIQVAAPAPVVAPPAPAIARRTAKPHVAPTRRSSPAKIVATPAIEETAIATATLPIEPPPAPVVVPAPLPPAPVVQAPPPMPPPPPPLWTTSRVTISALRVRGSLPDDDVRRAIDRILPAMQSCYRTSARAAHRSPAATVHLTLAIDGSRRATGVHAESAAWTTLAACTATAFDSLRVQNSPDVGDVAVVVDLAFQPVSP